MAEINLLPAKEFEIILGSGTKIEGKFGTWQAKRFCDKKGYTIIQLMELMSGDKITFDDVCQLILSAVEYKSRKQNKGFSFTDIDACEWIEELGGIGSEQYNKLMNHGATELKSEGEQTDEEKKSL